MGVSWWRVKKGSLGLGTWQEGQDALGAPGRKHFQSCPPPNSPGEEVVSLALPRPLGPSHPYLSSFS